MDEDMDHSAKETPEIKMISSESVIAQVCFDLGTLYFNKGSIEKAKSRFEICIGIQVCDLS